MAYFIAFTNCNGAEKYYQFIITVYNKMIWTLQSQNQVTFYLKDVSAITKFYFCWQNIQQYIMRFCGFALKTVKGKDFTVCYGINAGRMADILL